MTYCLTVLLLSLYRWLWQNFESYRLTVASDVISLRYSWCLWKYHRLLLYFSLKSCFNVVNFMWRILALWILCDRYLQVGCVMCNIHTRTYFTEWLVEYCTGYLVACQGSGKKTKTRYRVDVEIRLQVLWDITTGKSLCWNSAKIIDIYVKDL